LMIPAHVSASFGAGRSRAMSSFIICMIAAKSPAARSLATSAAISSARSRD